MNFIQCKFKSYEGEPDAELGGIAVYKYDHLVGVICGCCGRFIPAKAVRILKEYDFWCDFNEAMIRFHEAAEEWDDNDEEDI